MVLLINSISLVEDSTHALQYALARFFLYMDVFMLGFLFLVGYTAMIANFGVGIKAANFLFPMIREVLIYFIFCYYVFMLYICGK